MPVATAKFVVRRLPHIAAFFVVILLVFDAAATAARYSDDWQVSRIDQVDVFEYVAVEFTGIGPDGELLMASTAAWYLPVDRIEWLDRLDCSGTWSSQTFNAADRAPRPLTTVEWPYHQAWPTDGRECRMVSVISAEHRGRVFVQQIESAPFTPGRNTP